MRREFPLVIRKNGDKFIPNFPVELEAGDQLIIMKKMMGSKVPKGKRWTVSGYTASGPIISDKS